MTGMTYSTLIAQVISYLNRTDAQTIAQLENFVIQAQQRICREVETICTEQVVVSAFTVNNAVYQKPGRWRRTLAINVGSGANNNVRSPVFQRSYDYLRVYWPDDSETDLPEFYSDYGFNNILVAPTPNAAYPYEWTYLELPPPLSTSNQTNMLTDFYPDVLLYATLLEATPFLKNMELVPSWTAFVDRAFASMRNQNHSRLVDRQSFIYSDHAPAPNNSEGL